MIIPIKQSQTWKNKRSLRISLDAITVIGLGPSSRRHGYVIYVDLRPPGIRTCVLVPLLTSSLKSCLRGRASRGEQSSERGSAHRGPRFLSSFSRVKRIGETTVKAVSSSGAILLYFCGSVIERLTRRGSERLGRDRWKGHCAAWWTARRATVRRTRTIEEDKLLGQLLGLSVI